MIPFTITWNDFDTGVAPVSQHWWKTRFSYIYGKLKCPRGSDNDSTVDTVFSWHGNSKSRKGPSQCALRGWWVLIKLLKLKQQRNPYLEGTFWVVSSSSLCRESVFFETLMRGDLSLPFFSEKGPHTQVDCSIFVRKLFFMLNLLIPDTFWPYFFRRVP